MSAVTDRAKAAAAGARRGLRSPVVESVMIAAVITVGTVYIAPVVAGEVAYAAVAGADRAHRDVAAPARQASPMSTGVPVADGHGGWHVITPDGTWTRLVPEGAR